MDNTSGSYVSITFDVHESMGEPVTEVRCPRCNHLLYKVALPRTGSVPLVKVQIKCYKCNRVSVWPDT